MNQNDRVLFKNFKPTYYKFMSYIVELGDPVLRQKADPVDDVFSSETQAIIEQMKEALDAKQGIGIAAPQVGKSKQMFIVAPNQTLVSPYDTIDKGLIVINPSITFNSEQFTSEWEGCLSIPGIRGLVPRQCDITITYTNCHGELREEQYKDFIARIFLHEYDHLLGMVFLDRINNIKDNVITDGYYMSLKEDDE